jgi:hypothetical protein
LDGGDFENNPKVSLLAPSIKNVICSAPLRPKLNRRASRCSRRIYITLGMAISQNCSRECGGLSGAKGVGPV